MNNAPLATSPTATSNFLWMDRINQKSIRLAVINQNGKEFSKHDLHVLGKTLPQILTTQDEWATVSSSEIAEYDAVLVWRPCGDSTVAAAIAASRKPTFPLASALCFHPFHASYEREIESRNGLLLAAHSPSEVAGSIAALRACKFLQSARLLVIDDYIGQPRGQQIVEFAHGLKDQTGIQILHHSASELRERAASFPAEQVESEWLRLQNEVFAESEEVEGEKWKAHLLQLTRLFLALRQMLHETGAIGVTVADIEAFLLPHMNQFPQGVMPNVAYGALVDEGFLACEEGDIEALASELMLLAATGLHPTMSNIYLSYREGFDSVEVDGYYTPELEQADYESYLRDNMLMAAHFSTSGVLPPDMRVEAKAKIRETLPSWSGQCMVASTPKAGPVRLSRLRRDGRAIHHFTGEVTHVQIDDSKGWYRGRWYIEIDSVHDFIQNCQHQHYAIGPRGASAATTTWAMLLKLCGLETIG